MPGVSAGALVTEIDPEKYYDVAWVLILHSNKMVMDLQALDGQLNVLQSAGSYWPGGTSWGESFDQSASDIFELGSLGAIAATELGYQVHQAGLNHAHSENANSPAGPAVPTPSPPHGTSLTESMHPKELSVGGSRDHPDHWDLVSDLVTRQWADSSPDRITAAGKLFTDFGNTKIDDAKTLAAFATATWTAEEQKETEVSGVLDEINNVTDAMCNAGQAATWFGLACNDVGTIAKSDRDAAAYALKMCWISVKVLESTKYASKFDPFSPLEDWGIDKLIARYKSNCAKTVDSLMSEIDKHIMDDVSSNTGIYDTANTYSQKLSSILDRTPRQTNPIRNRPLNDDNTVAGDEGERRAGLDPNKPKERVEVNGRTIEPDYIDRDNRQVIEVKNANDLDPRSIEQIKLEEQYAEQQGYSMVLVTDHRTQINDSYINTLIQEGHIELVRKELDDNNDL